MKKLLILIPLLFFLTGCNNYRELNDLAIISGVSFKKENDTYIINAEIINPKKEQDASSGKETECVIYEGKGKSVQEAFRSIVRVSPQKLYGAHMNILIIDEKTAQEGISEILDFMARDPEIRSEFYVLISQSDNNLKIIEPLINISSKNIMESLKSTTTYRGTANLLTNHELLNDYLNPRAELVIPSIKLKGNKETGMTNTNIERSTTEADNIISNLTIFKDNKLIGTLTEKESLAYNIIQNKSETYLINNSYGDGDYIVTEIIASKSKIDADIKKKKITITITGTSAISEVNHKLNIEKSEDITKIQNTQNKNIEKLLANSIKDTITKYNSDIYGFEDLFYKTNPKETKKLIKKEKDNFLKNIKIEIKSNIKIVEKGNLNGGINEKRK